MSISFRGHRWLVIPAIVLVVHALPLRAQQSLDSLPTGSRISVAVSDSLRPWIFSPRRQNIHGTLTRATPDSVYFTVHGSAPIAMARNQIRAVFVSRGEHRGRSALSVGSLVALIAVTSNTHDTDHRKRLAFVAGSGAIGAVLGALWPFEHWKWVRK
jgi:hypothetical protein